MALFRFSFNLLLLVCCLWNILGFRSRFAQKLFRRTSQFDVCRKEDLKVQLRGEDLSDESPSIDDFNRGDIAPTHSNFTLPSPYDAIVDINGERKSLVFELTLTRDLGFEIIQGSGFPIVGKVMKYFITYNQSTELLNLLSIIFFPTYCDLNIG